MENKTSHPHEGMDYLMPGEEDDYEDEVVEVVTESEDDSTTTLHEIMKKAMLEKLNEDDPNVWGNNPEQRYADFKTWQQQRQADFNTWLQQQHHLDNYFRGSINEEGRDYYRYSNAGTNA